MKRTRKLTRRVACLVVAVGLLGLVPGMAAADDSTTRECVSAPLVKTPTIDLGVVRIPGRSNPSICVTWDNELEGTPTITFLQPCAQLCVVVRVSNAKVEQEVKVEVSYSEDGRRQQQVIHPSRVSADPDTLDRCFSIHDEGTADPCRFSLTAPTNLEAVGGQAKVKLAWESSRSNDGTAEVAGYEIYRSTTGEEGSFLLLTTVPDLSFTDKWVNSGQTYWYYVVSIDTEGKRSSGSNVASATPR